MTNAKAELQSHIESIGAPAVYYVSVSFDKSCFPHKKPLVGTLEEVLPLLDFNYDSGFGGQELFGTVWYLDGTWSDRREYDGSEWWEHQVCPPLPQGVPPSTPPPPRHALTPPPTGAQPGQPLPAGRPAR
jgi:hypothetical protein